MENNTPLHFTMFNNKVKVMNQANEKSLTLSVTEARNLHADIFELLNQYNNLIKNNRTVQQENFNVNMDGGNF